MTTNNSIDTGLTFPTSVGANRILITGSSSNVVSPIGNTANAVPGSNSSGTLAMQALSVTGQVLSGSTSTGIAFSTSSYSDTYATHNLLYSNGANTVTGLATANSGVLVTSGTGVPSISTTLPNGIALGAATATSVNFGGSTLSTYVSDTTWTPAVTFGTVGDLSVSYATQTGYYSQVGSIVTAHFLLAFTPTFTTASGNLEITGLPAVINSHIYAFGNCLIQAPTFPTGCSSVFLQGINGQSYMLIGANGSAVSAAYFTSAQVLTTISVIIQGSITYIV